MRCHNHNFYPFLRGKEVIKGTHLPWWGRASTRYDNVRHRVGTAVVRSNHRTRCNPGKRVPRSTTLRICVENKMIVSARIFRYDFFYTRDKSFGDSHREKLCHWKKYAVIFYIKMFIFYPELEKDETVHNNCISIANWNYCTLDRTGFHWLERHSITLRNPWLILPQSVRFSALSRYRANVTTRSIYTISRSERGAKINCETYVKQEFSWARSSSIVRIVSWYWGCDPCNPSSTLPHKLWQDNEMLLLQNEEKST